MRQSVRTRLVVLAAAAVVGLAGCGRKGPPLPPLRPVPGPVTAVTIRRVDKRIELRFAVPAINTDKTSPAAVARIEIYARSAPAGSARPIKEQVVLHENLVDTIDVKPPQTEEEKQAAAAATGPPPPPDPRPGDGDATLFTETLVTTAPTPLPALKGKAAIAAAAAAAKAQAAAGTGPAGVIPGRSPETLAGGPPAGAPGTPPAGAGTAAATTGSTTTGTTAATTGVASATAATGAPVTGAAPAAAAPPAAPAPPAKPLPATRYFWVQAISRHGQIGPPQDFIAIPLTDPPPPPTLPHLANDEKMLTFTWTPGADGETFRVYDVDRTGKEKDGHPLSDPLKDASWQTPVEFNHERCLAVRAVEITGLAGVESAPAFTCKTPLDTFPPAAPTNLNGLPDAGTVGLRWDGVTAADLGGYLVLRGEGTGGTLQQLTPAPITATTYVDGTVRPGVTYTYVVVAVDQSTPPNVSAHSNVYTVTIR
jgi:predicted small lipoprotein YifL